MTYNVSTVEWDVKPHYTLYHTIPKTITHPGTEPDVEQLH